MPPWAAMIVRQRANPNPRLRRLSEIRFSPVENISNTFSFASSGMPGPSSLTWITAFSPCAAAERMICDPAGVYLMALSTRLINTCTTSLASMRASSRSSAICTVIVCCALCRLVWRRASSNTSLTSSVEMDRFILPSSIREMERMFSTRLISHMESL